jgi:hypothetical protein
MATYDVYMRHSVWSETEENSTTTFTANSSITKRLSGVEFKDAKAAIVEFAAALPENCSNIEVNMYENQDIGSAVAKY